MPTVEYLGKTFTVDEDGFIDSFDNWCDEWVMLVKESEGIEELNDEHRKVVQVLCEFHIHIVHSILLFIIYCKNVKI